MEKTYSPNRADDWEIKQSILKNTDLTNNIFEQGYRKGVSDTLTNKHQEITILKDLIYKKDGEIYSLKSLLAKITIGTIIKAWLKKSSQTIMKWIRDLHRNIG